MNNWIGTLSGKKIDLMNPDPDQITIEDIGNALSRINRFNGHTRIPWTVLQHSVATARLVAESYKLQALLHDATEAYICDIPTPLKLLLGDSYREVERRIAHAIGVKFGVILTELPYPVKQADLIMLMSEKEYFQPDSIDWEIDYANGLRAPIDIFAEANSVTNFIRYVNWIAAL